MMLVAFSVWFFVFTNVKEGLTNSSTLSDLRFCGIQQKDGYLYEGNETSIDEFPWLALIIYERDPDIVSSTPFTKVGCAGSLINNRYVLTSASCLRFRTAHAAAVRLGEQNVKQDKDCVDFHGMADCANPVLDVRIEKTIKHPGYVFAPYAKNAIALIRLAKKVEYSASVRPICLPVPKLKVATEGDHLIATGFGRVELGGEVTIIKKRIDSVLISREDCKKQFFGAFPQDFLDSINVNPNDVISDKVICTNDVEGSPSFICEGDIGAPVMYVSKKKQWHLEGLIAWGSAPCKVGVPATHTKIRAYMDWIEQNMKM